MKINIESDFQPLGNPKSESASAQVGISHVDAIERDEVAPAAARISACTELLNRGHGRPVDQRAMLMIGAQLNSDRPIREWSTIELIERINDLRLADEPPSAKPY